MDNVIPSDPGTAGNLAACLLKADAPSQQETLGQIVIEILRSGRPLNRKSLCMSLLARADKSTSAEEEKYYQKIIGLLLRG